MAATFGASAQNEAMTNFDIAIGSSVSPVVSSIPGPIGWTFQPTVNISVTALGVFDGLPVGLEVGLWNSSGLLLASNTIVAANATAFGHSIYESINPVALDAGQTYYLAAFSPEGAFSAYVLSPNLSPPDGDPMMSPDIQLGTAVSINSASLEFPSDVQGPADSAIIAPNFEFVVVPEPSTICLFGLGALAAVARRRR